MPLVSLNVLGERLLSADRCATRDIFQRREAARAQRRLSSARPIRASLALNPNRTRHVTTVAANGQYAEVPLVFEVSPPVFSPLLSAAAEIAVSLFAAYVAVQVLQLLTRKYTEATWTSELAPDSRVKRSRTVTGAVLRAVVSPLSFILPIAAVFHSVRVLTCRMTQSMHLCTSCARNTLERRAEIFLDLILRVLQPVDDLIGSILKQAFLLAGIWFVITFKNQYVTWAIEQRAKRSPALLQDFKRIVIPLSDLLSWIIVGFGLVTAAGLAGVDIRPLVTFGGVSGIVVGLSAQSVLANMIAGINLFLSRPFVAGDRVQIFSNNGSLIYNGVVERINPLRTVIRTDRNYPMALPNKLLSEMVIANESRFPTMASLPFETGRQVHISLQLDAKHSEELDGIIETVKKVLETFPGLNQGIPFQVTIGAISDAQITLEIRAIALKRESAKFGELRISLMRQLKETLQQLQIEGYKLTF